MVERRFWNAMASEWEGLDLATLRRIVRSIALFCVCLTLLNGGNAFAIRHTMTARRKTPLSKQISLDAAERTDFDSTFTAISQKARITIVADGSPLHTKLTAGQLAELSETLPVDKPADLKEVIAKFALAYDYGVEQYSQHGFLLRKRYTNADDLPCVTYEELLNSLQQLRRLTSLYVDSGKAVNTMAALEQLYASFSPEQKAQAKEGIAVAELTSEQRASAHLAAGDLAIGQTCSHLQQTLENLQALEDPRTVFTYMRPAGDLAFGYRTWSASNDPPRDYALDTQPIPEGNRIPAELAVETPHTLTTLGEIVQRITTEASAKSSPRVSIDSGLAAKSVCVFGSEYSSTDSFVRALSALYRLELFVPHTGEYHFVLTLARTPRDSDDFGAEVDRLIPDPIRRALDRQPNILGGDRAARNQRGNLCGGIAEPSMDERNPLYPSPGRSGLYRTCYDRALHHLLLRVKPQVPTPDSPAIPLSQFEPEVTRLLGIMIYASAALPQIHELSARPLPHSLVNPESVVIRLNVLSLPKAVMVTSVFGYRDDTGTFQIDEAPIMLRGKTREEQTQ